MWYWEHIISLSFIDTAAFYKRNISSSFSLSLETITERTSLLDLQSFQLLLTDFCQICLISSGVSYSKQGPDPQNPARLIGFMSHRHDTPYIPLWCSFFRHSMFLTHVQSVIQIALVLVGRTAVDFTFSHHVFVQLTTPVEYGVFAFLLLNCILWYTCKTDEPVLLLLYILLISSLQCLHPPCFPFTRVWVASWNILKAWKVCSAHM